MENNELNIPMYNVKSFKEVREQNDIYEKVTNADKKTCEGRKEEKPCKADDTKCFKCFNCSSRDHQKSECKCFNCNEWR